LHSQILSLKALKLYSNTTIKRRVISGLLIVILFSGFTFKSAAQAYISSPYSIYGVGTLFSNISMNNMAMGGTSIAYRSPAFVNQANPASYTAFDSLSFIFEGGLHGRSTTLRTLDASYKDRYASLGYITMGFPVTNSWKASLGILPYSSIGYNIKNEAFVEGVGNTEQQFSGTGGLNKAYIGNAVKLGKNLSVGANLSYVFGTITKNRTILFPDSAYILSTQSTSEAVIRNLYVDLGIQYHQKLKNNYFLNLGATFSPAQSLKAKRSYYMYTFDYDAINDYNKNYDTVISVPDTAGKMKLPLSAGIGFSFGKSGRWSVGADAQLQNWSEYSLFEKNDLLKNSITVSIGGQYRPSINDLGSYWQRINYRGGFRYNSSHLEVLGTRLNDFGISFGVGLPLRKGSTINIAVETGTLGTTKNNLIKENYLKFTIGASLYERWFLKRRYN
jgi:hypothetical protein